MTTKEAIYEKVERLDESQARLILNYVEAVSSAHRVNYRNSSHDPMLDIIGMVRSSKPTNIAEFKDDYIAEAIVSHLEDGE